MENEQKNKENFVKALCESCKKPVGLIVNLNQQINGETKNKDVLYHSAITYLLMALIFLPLTLSIKIELFYAFCGLIIGNMFVAGITQFLHKELDSPHDFSMTKSISIYIRSWAGFLEMVFYTLTFTFGLFEVLVAFLVLKTLSVWKHESNQSLEGASTGILRIAVVLALLISFGISVYLLDSNFFGSEPYNFLNNIHKKT